MNTAGTQQNTAFGEDGLMILAKDVSQKDGSNGLYRTCFYCLVMVSHVGEWDTRHM